MGNRIKPFLKLNGFVAKHLNTECLGRNFDDKCRCATSIKVNLSWNSSSQTYKYVTSNSLPES